MLSTTMTLLLSSAPLVARGEQVFEVDQRADGSRWVRGELIVALAAGTDPAIVEARVRTLGGRVIERAGRLGLLRVQLASGADADSRGLEYARLEGVEYVERNGVGEGGGLPPDDTYFGEQWHLDNPSDADINALEAWSIQTGDPSIVVAVLDSGIDFTHPEFVGRTLPGFDFVGEDSDPTADHPHGILVTGLLAANADNAFGVAGVDHACTVLPVKVLNSSNLGTSFDLIQGIDYAVQQGARILSMSLINYPNTQALRSALTDARAAGAILIACGGNAGVGNADQSWPGASVRTIAIGWTSVNDRRATSSGTGAKLDFVAPGLGVITTSTSQVDARASFSGCSAATPVAAGVVSLLLAQDPTLDQDRVYEILRLSAADRIGSASQDPPGRDDFYGHGRLDALAALECLAECVGVTYCAISPNTFSSGARISARGSDLVSADDLTLQVDYGPPGVFGLFYYGPGQVETPFGDGLRCVGGMTARLNPPLSLDSGGSAARALSLPALGVAAGTSTNFQFWFRDTSPGGFNLTDGVRLDWQ